MLNLFTDLKLIGVGVASYFTGILSAVIFYEIHKFFHWIGTII